MNKKYYIKLVIANILALILLTFFGTLVVLSKMEVESKFEISAIVTLLTLNLSYLIMNLVEIKIKMEEGE